MLHAVLTGQGVVPAAPDGGIRWGSGLPPCGGSGQVAEVARAARSDVVDVWSGIVAVVG